MKSKTFFFNAPLFGRTLRRYGYLAVVYAVLLFLALPLPLVINLRTARLQEYLPTPAESVAYFFGWSNIELMGALSLLLGAVSGFVFTGYLFRPREVQFFHSQPVSRPTQLLHRALAALAVFALALLVDVVLSVVILLSFGVPVRAGMLLALAGYCLLGYAVMLAVLFFTAQLTGTAFAQAELALFFLALIPLSVGVASSLLETYTQERTVRYISGPVHDLLMKLSPVSLFLQTGGRAPHPLWVALTVLSAALLFLGAARLYAARPLERVGQVVIHRPVGSLVRLWGAILVGIMVSQFFSYLGNEDTLLAVIGGVLGLFLWNMVCQSQLHHTLKASLWGLRSLGAAALVCLALTLGAFFLAPRLVARLPRPEDLRQVTLDLAGSDPLTVTDPAAIRDIDAILQATFPEGEEWAEGKDVSLYATVTFYPRAGLPLARSVDFISLDKAREPLEQLYNEPSVRAQNVLLQGDLEAARYDWFVLLTEGGAPLPLTDEQGAALLAAYRADQAEAKPISVDEAPVAMLRLDHKVALVDAFYANIPLYPEDSRTLACLREMGCYTPLDDPTMAAAADTLIFYTGTGEIRVTDPEEIAEILANSIAMQGGHYWEETYLLSVESSRLEGNPWSKMGYLLQAIEDEDPLIACDLFLPMSRVPDFLQGRLGETGK